MNLLNYQVRKQEIKPVTHEADHFLSLRAWAGLLLEKFQIASAGLTVEKNSIHLFIASLLREHVICKHSPSVGRGRGLCGAKRPWFCSQDIPQHRGEKLQDLLQHWLSLFEQQWVRWSWKGTVTWQILCFMLLKKTVSLNQVFFRLIVSELWFDTVFAILKKACGCKKGSKIGFTLHGEFVSIIYMKAFDRSIGKDEHLAVAFFQRGVTFYKKER